MWFERFPLEAGDLRTRQMNRANLTSEVHMYLVRAQSDDAAHAVTVVGQQVVNRKLFDFWSDWCCERARRQARPSGH